MNAIGVSIVSALVVMVLFSPRRWALIGMMIGVLYIAEGQQVTLMGFNMFPTRFLELAGFLRVLSRKEFSLADLNGIDKLLLIVYGYTTAIFLLRSTDGAAYQIGLAVDALLCYITFRGLIRDATEVKEFLKTFVFLLAPFFLLVSFEHFRGHNPFTIVGALDATDFRNGAPRCAGSFRHPSLLGTLGASFLPLYISLFSSKETRKHCWIGAGLCLGIVWLCNSGAPVAAVFTGLAGWSLWTFRTKMYVVRRAMLFGLIALALVMKSPVWYIFDRVGFLTGGDGWHRSYLIDMAYQHLGKWWLAGMPTVDTSEWFPYSLVATGGSDITNAYLSFGLSGGLFAMILFVWLLVRSYSYLGKALLAVRSGREKGKMEHELMLWGLGVMLTVHVGNWFGITYWDQTYVLWFFQLAMISGLSSPRSSVAKNLESFQENHTGAEEESAFALEPTSTQDASLRFGAFDGIETLAQCRS